MKISKLRWSLLAAVTVVLIPSAAQANDWFFLTEADDGSFRIFVDEASIIRSNDIVRADVFFVDTQTGRDGSVGSLLVEEFSCGEGTYRVIEATTLYDDQSVRQARTPDLEWIPIDPETIGEAILQNVCSHP